MDTSKTILYAEDDAVTLNAYKNRLEQAGYRVQTATDGLQALRALHQSPPDLILLDLMLPRFTGEEVLKFLASNPALDRIPVIVLSTNSILNMENEALVQKAERHFFKHDCKISNLLEAIEDLLSAPANCPAESALPAVAVNHPLAGQPLNGNGHAHNPEMDPLLEEIKELKSHMPVVCAWTDRVNIDGKWLKLTEFLSERLHLQVSHGISPDAAKQLLNGE